MIVQRNPNTPRILDVRPLVRDDLQYLQAKSATLRLRRLRESHHMIARLFALGLRTCEIAERLGYTATRVGTLRSDPAIQELIAKYRGDVDQSWRQQVDAYTSNSTRALQIVTRMMVDELEDLEEKEERLPFKTALSAYDTLSDRFGRAKKTTNVNVNIDFAAKLEAARRRSATVIEGAAVVVDRRI